MRSESHYPHGHVARPEATRKNIGTGRRRGLQVIYEQCVRQQIAPGTRNFNVRSGASTHGLRNRNQQPGSGKPLAAKERPSTSAGPATRSCPKSAEASGKHVLWKGLSSNVFSINIVPNYPSGVADFGHGDPVYAQILTHNVSGIRLFNTPNSDKIVVEASIPENLPEHYGIDVIKQCTALGLAVEKWHDPK